MSKREWILVFLLFLTIILGNIFIENKKNEKKRRANIERVLS